MDQQAALEYLNDYVNDPKIVALADVSAADRALLPQSWQHILSVEGPERLQRTIAAWGDFQAEFAQTIEFLKAYLAGVELIHHDGAYSLLYGLPKPSSGKMRYYEARNPKLKKLKPEVEAAWPKFPEGLRRFYEQFHNGWYHLSSEAMGPLPAERIFPLSSMSWGILETIGPQPIDLKSTYAIFFNGSDTYLSIELKADNVHTLLWSTQEAPTYNLDFWPVLDSWTLIGLDV